MNKTDRFALTLALTLIFFMLLLSVESFAERCFAIRGETLRLHIVANSDSENDQRLKLLVRDKILKEYSQLLSGENSSHAASLAEFLSKDITITTEKLLQSYGDYSDVSVSVENMYFDTRTYDNKVTLPAGDYTALRIVIGEGKGHNWWCVMYPPLCIPVASGEQAKEVEQEIKALQETPSFKAKFAVVELAERLMGSAKEREDKEICENAHPAQKTTHICINPSI